MKQAVFSWLGSTQAIMTLPRGDTEALWTATCSGDTAAWADLRIRLPWLAPQPGSGAQGGAQSSAVPVRVLLSAATLAALRPAGAHDPGVGCAAVQLLQRKIQSAGSISLGAALDSLLLQPPMVLLPPTGQGQGQGQGQGPGERDTSAATSAAMITTVGAQSCQLVAGGARIVIHGMEAPASMLAAPLLSVAQALAAPDAWLYVAVCM
jgi:hypothetical protein